MSLPTEAWVREIDFLMIIVQVEILNLYLYLVGVLFSKNNSDLKPFMNGFRCHTTVNVIVHTNN